MNKKNWGQNKEDVNRLVDRLTLFDDDLMSRVFDQNVEATELVLRIILGRNIKVIRAEGQDERKNHAVGGRNVTLDVHALDENGEEIDIEVQGNSEGAHIRRARYHSSMVDSGMLREGQQFKQLKDFHQADPEKIHYDALAQGVKHFKETEGGREKMCEAVEEYAKEYAKEYAAKEKAVSVRNLMENMKLTLEQALNALGIQGDERTFITKQLQK